MNSFQCLELDPKSCSLQLVRRNFPRLKENEVLLRVHASPINPSDRLFCQGLYAAPAKDKIVPGFEGSGTVVQTGKKFVARRLKGKRVAGAVQGQDGFWAEYVVVPAERCLVLNPKISEDAASCAFVNPLTAIALLEPLRKKKFSALVQTAAASQLGRMIEKACRKYKIPAVHVVHRPDLKEALMIEGFSHVLDSTDKNFEEDLKRISHQLNARYAIDAVGGKMTGVLAKNLPESSQVVVYGVLSGQKCEIEPSELIFRNVSICGFWLSHWLKDKNPFELIRVFSNLKKSLVNENATTVARRIKLDQVPQEIQSPASSSSFGKILVVP